MTSSIDYSQSRKTAKILQAAGARRESLEALALSCGLDVLPSADPNMSAGRDNTAVMRNPDFILADLSSVTDQITAALETITPYLNEYGTELLVWASADQLDVIDACLPERGRHILCDAQDFEAVPILSGAYAGMNLQQLKQDDAPTDYRALHRISDELADFARTLARIAEQDEQPGNTVSDRPVTFRPAPAAIFEAIVPDVPATPPGDHKHASTVREILKLRRRRERFFSSGLFADPAWDILLDLYAARLEHKKVSVSSLCIAAAVPPTTALRWIATMTEDGLLVREQDPGDARRVFIGLSESATESLRAYIEEAVIGAAKPI